MLTNEQLVRLEPLTTDSRYGKLLSDAIEVWKQKNVIPKRKVFGIVALTKSQIEQNTISQFIYGSQNYTDLIIGDSPPTHCHCLIGACLINKDAIGYAETIFINYNISSDEMNSLIQGFDHCSLEFPIIIEAYDFGKSVNKALWPKSSIHD